MSRCRHMKLAMQTDFHYLTNTPSVEWKSIEQSTEVLRCNENFEVIGQLSRHLNINVLLNLIK